MIIMMVVQEQVTKYAGSKQRGLVRVGSAPLQLPRRTSLESRRQRVEHPNEQWWGDWTICTFIEQWQRVIWFNDTDFPLEFGVPQATVNTSSPLKEGDVLLDQGVSDARSLLARDMEERFLHNYVYKSRADERSWWCVLCPHPPQIQVYECTSLRFLLVLSRFLSCVYSLCSVRSFSHSPYVSQKNTEIYNIILWWEILKYAI